VRAPEIYDQIGVDYASKRQPDPRWVVQIHQQFEGCRSLLNVGAGTGSYEPSSGTVVGVEPSQVMIRQRSPSAAPAVRRPQFAVSRSNCLLRTELLTWVSPY
jgi:hypothetical protein